MSFVEQAADTADSVMQVKVAANEAVFTAQQAVYNQSLSSSQLQAREADIRALADLTRALDMKVIECIYIFVKFVVCCK